MADRGKTKPIAVGDVDFDLLVEMLLPASNTRSRTQLRMRLEDDMAAAVESAMRGRAATFLDIYEYVPDGLELGGIHKVRRTPGPLLRSIAKTHCFAPIDPESVVPQPFVIRDLLTGAVNERLSPGGAGDLRGIDLQYDAEAPDEGIFLVDVLDGSEFRLTTEALAAEPREAVPALRLQIPESLPGGHYRLEVRNRPAGKSLKVGALSSELRVD